jgi:hypothetical protein
MGRVGVVNRGVDDGLGRFWVVLLRDGRRGGNRLWVEGEVSGKEGSEVILHLHVGLDRNHDD